MFDQSGRILLQILRTTQYLVSHYGKGHDAPKMVELRLALIETIAQLEAAGADSSDDLKLHVAPFSYETQMVIVPKQPADTSHHIAC